MNESKEASENDDVLEDGEEEIKLCSFCQQPPRRTKSGRMIPLKECSRCHQAWYHDSNCQKQHYPIHKTICRSVITTTTTKNGGIQRAKRKTVTNPTKESVPRQEEGQKTQTLRVQARKGRGNCLLATTSIRKGEQISPLKGGRSTWEAFVPPVLLESQRHMRCALCFGILKEEEPPFRYNENNHSLLQKVDNNLPYIVLFCSQECLRKGREYGFDTEEATVRRLYERGPGPPKIFSTAILLYRLWNANLDIRNELNRLQSKPPDGKHPTNESYEHTRCVVATAAAMVNIGTQERTPLSNHQESIFNQMKEIVDRIKINSFSICDGETIPMGIGIFSIPSFMNHSCQPNIIQTFFYGCNDHRPPTLHLTASTNISAGEELMISYLDNSTPRHIRRKQLLEDYYFLCDCPGCEDNDRNSNLMGLRCTYCKDPNIPLEEVVNGIDPSPMLTLRCRSCSADDFGRTLQKIHSLERPDDDQHYRKLPRLKRRFDDMKRLCFPGSWYVLESGERLVRACLDGVGESDDRREQEQYASKALLIFNYLSNTSGASYVTMDRPLSTYSRRCLNELKMRLEHLSHLCFRNPTSCFTSDRGDLLEEVFRDWLGPSQDDEDEDRKKYTTTKTVVASEDMEETTDPEHESLRWSSTSLEYRHAIQLCQIIKLKLFLYPRPPPSTFLFLEKCFSFLSMFYPDQLELINDIFVMMQPTLILDG